MHKYDGASWCWHLASTLFVHRLLSNMQSMQLSSSSRVAVLMCTYRPINSQHRIIQFLLTRHVPHAVGFRRLPHVRSIISLYLRRVIMAWEARVSAGPRAYSGTCAGTCASIYASGIYTRHTPSMPDTAYPTPHDGPLA